MMLGVLRTCSRGLHAVLVPRKVTIRSSMVQRRLCSTDAGKDLPDVVETPSRVTTGSSLVSGPSMLKEKALAASFTKFPFRREVQLGVMNIGIAVPTAVQDLAIPKLLEGISVFLLAQTGTGKTLAYVLPIVHRLLESNAERFYPMPNKPRAIMIVPTRELALQLLMVVRQFPIQSVALTAGQSFTKEARSIDVGVDIVCCTPKRLLKHLDNGDLHLSQVSSIVVDEADTLCDTFYEDEVKQILQMTHKAVGARKPQLVVVGATRTGAVSGFLQHYAGGAMVPVVAQDAHTTPPQLDQVFVPTKGKRRMVVLQEILAELPTIGTTKSLIFTNRVGSCRAVHRGLLEHGVNSVALHGDMSIKRRKEVFREFQNGQADVMVATNLASRGLDMSDVHHVIMFDFPQTLGDYLHRVGRTARGGKAGRVTTITPRRCWPLVRKIQEAAQAGKPIEVKYATKNVRKVLALERYLLMEDKMQSGAQRRRAKKKLGLPPRKGVASPERKLLLKSVHLRTKAIRHMRFLQKRGLLRKGHGIPQRPDATVEKTESQTISTLIRAKDGLLQVIPRRRAQMLAHPEGPAKTGIKLDGQDLGGKPKRMQRKREQRPVM